MSIALDGNRLAIERHRELYPNGCGFALCAVCSVPAPVVVRPAACTRCGGAGVVTFCPSEPDKCRGCETVACPDCGVRS